MTAPTTQSFITAVQQWKKDRDAALAEYVDADGEVTDLYKYDETRTTFGDNAYDLLDSFDECAAEQEVQS